ncbi:uncharacterized protein Triagg1_4273 [Trichoderma aggressivum f. europaeum]|uniref:F-box domain-containing protein n=1 Tax=Trichoderma aggressivum f. europaeum TaxID=173218 RepID=A0AAE1JBM0_9HYPO|nr:hypothetical protein Triagg1_4273 [Trichoderma aggressivum f. europaeum]
MTLPNVPKELWDQIATCLTGRDVKSLRLACKSLSGTPLPLDRVFISANPIDIRVFRNIADHDVFRHCVREIIWDEARFERDFRVDASSGLEWTEMGNTEDIPPDDFLTECRHNLDLVEARFAQYRLDLPFIALMVKEMEAELTTYESWWYCRQFLGEQRRVLADDLDIKAFDSWDVICSSVQNINDPNFAIWLELQHSTWLAGLGLVWSTTTFVDLLQRPGFRRLDLALMAGQQEPGDWESLRNGRLRSALAEASDLEHFQLNTDIGYHRTKDAGAHLALLHDICPIVRRTKLRHFGLTRFLSQRDLVASLSKLPASVRTVELNCLYFLSGDGTYRDLLDAMHESLDWKTRNAAARPKVTIKPDRLDHGKVDGRTIWLEEEAGKFLYEGGPNPFHQVLRDEVLPGHGGKLRDEFQPDLVHPWVDYDAVLPMEAEKESPSVTIEGGE